MRASRVRPAVFDVVSAPHKVLGRVSVGICRLCDVDVASIAASMLHSGRRFYDSMERLIGFKA